ncbi:MAG: glycosyltransferase family 2 protein [Burkholderiales bacterium]
MKTAVIVTTYNRPDALAAVFAGYFAQSDSDFELLVADDGSTNETRLLIEENAARAPFSLHHVWQEDRGFRPGAARNRAVAHTQAEYLIFVDGDCIPARDFVRRHKSLAEKNYFLSGNRVLLSESFTRRALAGQLPLHRWRATRWLQAWMARDVNRLLPLLTLRDTPFRKRWPQQWQGVKTCNLSLWRADFMRVNGFDESYSGWGLEDSDLAIRLIHAGVHHKSARFATPVFHLWHRESDRDRLAENQKLLDEIIASDRIEARMGVNQYL